MGWRCETSQKTKNKKQKKKKNSKRKKEKNEIEKWFALVTRDGVGGSYLNRSLRWRRLRNGSGRCGCLQAARECSSCRQRHLATAAEDSTSPADCGSSNCCWTFAAAAAAAAVVVAAAVAAAAVGGGGWKRRTTTTQWVAADSFSVWVEVRAYKVLIWAGVMAFYGRRDYKAQPMKQQPQKTKKYIAQSK